VDVSVPSDHAPAFSVHGDASQGARERQEDSFRLRTFDDGQSLLFVLADGMGGQASGEVASKLVVDGFMAAFAENYARADSLEELLWGSLNDANMRVYTAQSMNPELVGMGSTIVAGYLNPAGLVWISVGDSPLWRLKDGVLERLNEDHSLRSVVQSKDARVSANSLMSAVTGTELSLVDCRADPLPVNPGEIIVAASDGLLTLSDQALVQIMEQRKSGSASGIVKNLLNEVAAAKAPKQDNCTVIAVALTRPSGGAVDRQRLLILAALAALLGVGAAFLVSFLNLI